MKSTCTASKRKLDLSVGVPSQHPGRKQSVHIAMNRLYVPARATRRFAQRHRSAPGHGLEQFPTLGSEQPPEQVRRRNGDMRSPPLAGERIERTPRDGLARRQGKGHGLHLDISLNVYPKIGQQLFCPREAMCASVLPTFLRPP